MEYNQKKMDCYWYEAIVDVVYYIGLNGDPEPVYELHDEVCHCLDKGGPLHHYEYDCTNCPFYKKNK